MFFRDRRSAGTTRQLPLLPLRDLVVLPQAAVSFIVGREKSIAAMNEAQKAEKEVFLATQREPGTTDPSESDVHTIGTIAAVIQVMRLPDNTQRVLVDGRRRGKIVRFIHEGNCTWVEVEELPEQARGDAAVEAQMRSARQLFEEYAKARNISMDAVLSINGIDEPVRLGFALARHISSLKTADRQQLLELDDPAARLERLLTALRAELEMIQAERRVRTRPRRTEQRAPEAEGPQTGEKDEFRSELAELETRIQERALPAEALDRCQRELRKLRMMSPMSAEATVVRNYLDWILALPWGESPPVAIDLIKARQTLDGDHQGLHKVKQRILEYLAVLKRLGGRRIDGPILCLVGPPGVGKTSLAKSIANATGRPFVRVALGGVRDEAEVRGHRRTYIGSMPGRIVQGMRKAGANNPVFLLDEVDKLSSDFRGDPASALLEVLDPEQNKAFNDHYLDLDYDLSNVLFVCTANNLEGIPVPLQDRLEIVRLSGYTDAEKKSIVRHHLLPRQLTAHGLRPELMDLRPDALDRLIREYTREAGVRSLERELAALCRKVARRVEEQGNEKPVVLNALRVEKLLGPPRHRQSRIGKAPEAGFVSGLAWTATGGVVVPIEAAVVPGTGKLTMTGKLGEVFREAAQSAVTYMRSRAESFGLGRDFWEHLDLHIHIPELWGVDGPSAGITIATAVVSAVCNVPVRHDVAMTGEITLRGQVRPIGGLKEKLLAARQAGVQRVLIPMDNEKDLRDLPKNMRGTLDVVLVEHMDDVLRLALVEPLPRYKGEPVEQEQRPQ
ncbi:MAG TPA: endopeptidase La [Myxococcota bacterium]|nr:endopeptidase La [Myxococcota bacterium]